MNEMQFHFMTMIDFLVKVMHDATTTHHLLQLEKVNEDYKEEDDVWNLYWLLADKWMDVLLTNPNLEGKKDCIFFLFQCL